MQSRLPAITEDPKAIAIAPRAVVYLTVEWSSHERQSRLAFAEAAASLPPELGATAFVVAEDAPAIKSWLASSGWANPAVGCGSVLWFESGNFVAGLLGASQSGATAIAGKTAALWGPPAA